MPSWPLPLQETCFSFLADSSLDPAQWPRPALPCITFHTIHHCTTLEDLSTVWDKMMTPLFCSLYTDCVCMWWVWWAAAQTGCCHLCGDWGGPQGDWLYWLLTGKLFIIAGVRSLAGHSHAVTRHAVTLSSHVWTPRRPSGDWELRRRAGAAPPAALQRCSTWCTLQPSLYKPLGNWAAHWHILLSPVQVGTQLPHMKFCCECYLYLIDRYLLTTVMWYNMKYERSIREKMERCVVCMVCVQLAAWPAPAG